MRLFQQGYTYTYESVVNTSFNNQTGGASYKFSIICNNYNLDGYNMTMVLEELNSQDGKTGINFLEQIKNFTRDISESKNKNKNRFLQKQDNNMPNTTTDSDGEKNPFS